MLGAPISSQVRRLCALHCLSEWATPAEQLTDVLRQSGLSSLRASPQDQKLVPQLRQLVLVRPWLQISSYVSTKWTHQLSQLLRHTFLPQLESVSAFMLLHTFHLSQASSKAKANLRPQLQLGKSLS